MCHVSYVTCHVQAVSGRVVEWLDSPNIPPRLSPCISNPASRPAATRPLISEAVMLARCVYVLGCCSSSRVRIPAAMAIGLPERVPGVAVGRERGRK